MKMIRVGTTSQSRIAQACDRCRSKKIRCDGVRPCCSQCANVGFECKTSDKLSRRAFPRGYTESLEDRVRGLEAEVKELKDLLDEKDEKIDMLSRIHNFAPIRKQSTSSSPAQSAQLKSDSVSSQEDVLHVEIPAPVQPSTTSTGTTTTSALIEAFDSKLQDQGRQSPPITPSALLAPPIPQARSPGISNNSTAPPRVLSDQYISMFSPLLLAFRIANNRVQISFSKNGNHCYLSCIVRVSCDCTSNSLPSRMLEPCKVINSPLPSYF